MGGFFNVDWRSIFVPDTPLLEIFIRGTIMYLGLFILLRLILKRETGSIGITDLLLVVLLSNAAQNGMANDYHSIPDGLILLATLVFWSYTLNWLGYRFPKFEQFVHPPPLLLVKDGRMLYHNMRKEFITESELTSMLREQGVDDVSRVQKAFIEGSGRVSVITKDNERHQEQETPAK